MYAMSITTDRMHGALERLSRKWWAYALICLLFFIPSYAARGYDPRQFSALIESVLRRPFIYALSPLNIVFKLTPVLLMAAVLVLRNRARQIYHAYLTLLFLAIAVFQNSASTERYGLVVISGNVVLIVIVAFSWLWETVSRQTDYAVADPAPWKWPYFALALLAFWFPADSATAAPDFSVVRLAANESMMTYCMATPVVLAFLLLYFPRVNLVTMRVSAFIGVIFGVINTITWFVLDPSMWWMGVLHVPLLLISLLCFVLATTAARSTERPRHG
jgi:hypothetical protein